MKILITGSAGFLGKNLVRKLKERYEVTGIDRNKSEWTDREIDLTDKKAVRKAVEEIKPDVIIHTAALTNVEYCETHREEARAINVGGTSNLVDSIRGAGMKFIFISSDYVYDGKKGDFDEESPTRPISWYGQNKLDAERIIQMFKDYLILRSSVIFGWDPGGKNFFMQLCENQKNKKEMRVPIDQISNPTYIELIKEIITRSIEKNLQGIFIATGPESMTRYDFALKIADVCGFKKNLIIPVQTKELGQAAKRPLNCGVKIKKLENALGMKFPSLSESLLHLLKGEQNVAL